MQLGEYYYNHVKETALEAVNSNDVFENSCEYERRNEFLVYIKCEEFPGYLQNYPLSYRVPVRERYGSTLLPATREQHDQNCTQSH